MPFGISITIQNKICMIHFKHNKIEFWKTLSEFTQLRVADLIEIFRNCFWYRVASLIVYIDISSDTQFSNAIEYFHSKNRRVSKLRFSAMI